MSSHSNRSDYFMVHGEKMITYSTPQSPEVLTPAPGVTPNGGAAGVQPRRSREPRFLFGRMFEEITPAEEEDEKKKNAVIAELVKLAETINANADDAAGESDIRAGYTYLGQFIAHEITFDKTEEPLDGENPGYRSPQIDLDSLYGRGPERDRRFYEDDARLKVGETIAGTNVRRTFFADLPRAGYGSTPARTRKALIPDPRNDENLPLAQTHLAFIKFHNKVVDAVHLAGTPPDQLFETARKEVCQHFQWIILHDFLPNLLSEETGDDAETLKSFKKLCPAFFESDVVFMPLEFSVAAFRFGHSMVRNRYEWNALQNSRTLGAANIKDLFKFTGFSGDLNGKPRLESDWIIDWRRFYDFPQKGLGFSADNRRFNMARRIDPSFSLRLEDIPGYPHVTQDPAHQSIVARNLLRGYACRLPCAEDIIKVIDVKEPLTEEQIGIDSPLFKGRTPLWYYILKEAEHNNGKLGPVAGFIVAATLIRLIQESPNSILKEENWKPKYGRRAETEQKFDMVDLLDFAEFVDPLGERFPNLSFEGS